MVKAHCAAKSAEYRYKPIQATWLQLASLDVNTWRTHPMRLPDFGGELMQDTFHCSNRLKCVDFTYFRSLSISKICNCLYV